MAAKLEALIILNISILRKIKVTNMAATTAIKLVTSPNFVVAYAIWNVLDCLKNPL